jgi:hypothetical protein
VLAHLKDLSEAGGKTAEDKKALRTALKLTEEAGDEDVLAEIKKLTDSAKEDKNRADELTARVAKMELREVEKDRDAVISAAMKEGKITPKAEEKWKAMWMKDPEGTKELIADLEVVVDQTEVGGDGGPTGNMAAVDKLNAVVKATMKETGKDYATALKLVAADNPALVEEAQ